MFQNLVRKHGLGFVVGVMIGGALVAVASLLQ